MSVIDHSKQFRAKSIGLWGLLLASFISTVSCSPQSKPVEPKRLVTVEGATLDQFFLAEGNVAYLQTIDLRKMQIDQLVGEVAKEEAAKGLYYPNNVSPFFKRLTRSEVRNTYIKQHSYKIFSIVNASFFEEYKSSTRLSFPIKVNGALITAGSSPYGPIQKPAEPHYQTVQLKALTWDDTKATVSDYNPETGYPLSQPGIQNGIVSYAYQDHPAYVFNNDPANLYHVIGVFNSNDEAKAHRLLIITTNRTTLEGAAEILRQQGVKSDIITIDSGISTYLWSPQAGELISPQVAEGEKTVALPHYLGIRAKK
jgi:hypothetical protein